MRSTSLQQIATKEGVLFPIFKDWEKWHGGYEPKMVYATTINPGVTKGPILHEKRRGLITAIEGCVSIRMKQDGEFSVFNLRNSVGDAVVMEIPAGVPYTLTNHDLMHVAVVINCPDRAWHPDDEDTTKFDSWEDVP